MSKSIFSHWSSWIVRLRFEINNSLKRQKRFISNIYMNDTSYRRDTRATTRMRTTRLVIEKFYNTFSTLLNVDIIKRVNVDKVAQSQFVFFKVTLEKLSQHSRWAMFLHVTKSSNKRACLSKVWITKLQLQSQRCPNRHVKNRISEWTSSFLRFQWNHLKRTKHQTLEMREAL